MKEMTKKKDKTKLFFAKHVYLIFKQSCGLPEVTKQILICLCIFILVFCYYIFILIFCYYINMCTYNYSNDNCELISLCTISFEESKPVNINQPKIWYKYFFDDFLNTFTSNGKAINYKIIEVKSDIKTLIPLELEHNLETRKEPAILNKIQSDHMRSIILECEFYKNKASLLEIQLLKDKVYYQDLIKDINDIVKEINDSFKKP